MKITCIIVAAGKGRRMGTEVPKQYIEVDGKPVLFYTLKAWEESRVDDVVLVVPDGDVSYVSDEIVGKYGFKKVSQVVAGGAERYDSVYKGLVACEGTDYVLIHDGVRSCVSDEVIERAVKAAGEYEAFTVAVPVKDTVKVADSDEYAAETPDRKTLWAVQTPQGFRYSLIRKAYEEMRGKDMSRVTDDTMIVEEVSDVKVKLIMGSYDNIKVTTPEDLAIMKVFLE